MTTYEEAGVNISEADRAVTLFKEKVLATFDAPGVAVRTDFGQFAALVHFSDIPDYSFGFSMDGIGTKLMYALRTGNFSTVGECLVAHCINDLLTAGIRARTLNDYVACGKLDAKTAAAIIGSIADACKKFGLVLTGGELAEMPGVYIEGQYDMVASIMGTVIYDQIIDGSRVMTGDVIMGYSSSGLHCNGYSLIRKIFADVDLNDNLPTMNRTYGDEFLKPSRCYAKSVLAAIEKGCKTHGMANITGGGIPGNLSRILPKSNQAIIDQSVIQSNIPEIMDMAQRLGSIPWESMVKTFNLGIGYIVVLPESEIETLRETSQFPLWKIGVVAEGDVPKIVFDEDWGEF